MCDLSACLVYMHHTPRRSGQHQQRGCGRAEISEGALRSRMEEQEGLAPASLLQSRETEPPYPTAQVQTAALPPPTTSLENRWKCWAVGRFHLLHKLLELFVLLVPLVDGCQQVLGLHLAAHDEEVVAEVVQLMAGTVCPIF